MKRPEDFVLPEMKKAFQKSVEVFEEEVKKRTPVETGRLRNSIHVEEVSTEGETWTGVVATDVEYAAFIEYGVRRWSKKNPIPIYRKKGPVAMFRRGKAVAEQKMKRRIRKAVRKGLQEYLKNI